jgi:hypothetical protein
MQTLFGRFDTTRAHRMIVQVDLEGLQRSFETKSRLEETSSLDAELDFITASIQSMSLIAPDSSRNWKGSTGNLPCWCLVHRSAEFFIHPIVIEDLADQSNRSGHADTVACYFSFSYSALAAFRIGMSGSASFQRARKSW